MSIGWKLEWLAWLQAWSSLCGLELQPSIHNVACLNKEDRLLIPKARKNVLVLQSGGCTPVINRSLVGLVQEVFRRDKFGGVYGAVHGVEGVLEGNLIDLNRQPKKTWPGIATSPGAALGSGRRNLKPEDLPRALDTINNYGIGYLFTIGGNDTAETALKISNLCQETGRDLVVLHIPKTIDNDLLSTDHSPGYGSTARFIALATMGAGLDAEAMGEASPITILEVMGRDAGWLAASASLGKREEQDAPHIVCIPEIPVDEGRFLQKMEDAYRRWGYGVAVTAENSTGPSGPLGGDATPFFVDDFGHKYFEGPAQYLARLVSHELKVRVRFEKPGTVQRTFAACVSRTDALEATLVGQAAVGYALDGHNGVMVTLVREPGPAYSCGTGLAPLDAVAGKVKLMPDDYFDVASGLATQEYMRYATPLLGAPLPVYRRLDKIIAVS